MLKSNVQFNYDTSVERTVGLKARADQTKAELFGLELEVIGTNLPSYEEFLLDGISDWSVHTDNSVRPRRGEAAKEYVFSRPMSIEETRKNLDILTDFFNKKGTKIRPSHQTSVHVHVNVRGQPIINVFNLLTLHTMFETFLVQHYCGDERTGNVFCLRLQDARGALDWIRDAVEAGSPRGVFVGENRRYLLMNLQSVGRFGSVEFRGMRGTIDKEKIMEWVEVLRDFTRAAGTFQNPREIIESISAKGVRGFITSTFRNLSLVKAMLNFPDIQGVVWKGMRIAQDIAYLDPYWTRRGTKEEKAKPKKEAFLDDTETLARAFWRDAVAAGGELEIRRPTINLNDLLNIGRD